MGGMNEMMRQAARMQRKVDQAKEEIKAVEVSASAAGDKVKAVVTCEGKVKQLSIDPEFLQQEGLEMALDALAAATNAALAEADRKVEEHINKATGIKSPLR
jgi:DNA-binding YbaB/EbfC family protein